MLVYELVLARKIGGTENPKGARLRPGSRGAMRGREGSRRRLVADACQGIQRQSRFLVVPAKLEGNGSRVAMRSVRLGAGLMQPLGYGRMQRRLSFLIRENDRQPCQISGLRVQRTSGNKTHPTALVGWALYERLTIHPRGRNTKWASLSLIVRRNRPIGQLLKGWRHRRDQPSISP